MIGMQELLVIIVILAIVFFFGKDKVKEWLSMGKEIKQDLDDTTKKKVKK
jgi:Tfp pilus assembly protein FimT